MTTVVSDESRRDNQFNGRLMDTDQFPTATFVLTRTDRARHRPGRRAPITATASGELTLRDVTNPVTLRRPGAD